MLLQRQIVVKALDKQIDIEDPDCMKYAITSFLLLRLDVHICQCYHIQDCTITTEVSK